MPSPLKWLREEALSNPVILRESGLAYSKRELGLNPGRAKLILTGLMLLSIAGAPVLLSQRLSQWVDVSFLVALVTLPVMLFAGMFDAPRAFSGGTDRAYTEDLLLTPLGSHSVAHGKVFARGLPIMLYAAFIAAFGVVAIATTTIARVFMVEANSQWTGVHAGLMCLVGSVATVRCYLLGLHAGLHERHVAIRAVWGYLKTIAACVVFTILAISYVESSLFPSRGFLLGGVSLRFERNLDLTRVAFRHLVLLSTVPLMYLWCRSVYVRLVASLDVELKRRLGLLDE